MSNFCKTRVIPILLLKGKGLVKTIKFKKPTYIGDPINSVRIFNEKEVDELVFFDINASIENKKPDFKILEDIAEEAFMPMSYGGGIKTLDDIKKIFNIGFEKVILNSTTYHNKSLIREAANIYGSQSIVACVDVKKSLFGNYKIYSKAGSISEKSDLINHCKNLQDEGIGEIIINSIDLDGTGKGYDLDLIKKVSKEIKIPIVASGGASTLEHLRSAVVEGGASSVAAGSMFVFMGKHRAVLINYPERKILNEILP